MNLTTNLYALKNIVEETTSPPFCSQNDVTAVRVTKKLLSSEGCQPESEFRLYKIGSWNEMSLTLHPKDVPEEIAIA